MGKKIYQNENEKLSNRVKIFDQEITIFNPGTLFGGLTIEDLKTNYYQAQARNKLITEAFYLTKDIEKYGSGYRRVRDEIAVYPTMELDFMETSGGYLVKISYENQKTSLKDVGLNVGLNKEDIQKQILIEIEKNPAITITMLSEKLTITTRTVERHIDTLKKLNIIERSGSKKTGYWKVIN